MKGPRNHARALLRKAGNDLVAATAILATGKALDTVCFHAQQATEKALKALLSDLGIEYPYRHDLGELMALAMPCLPALKRMQSPVMEMSRKRKITAVGRAA